MQNTSGFSAQRGTNISHWLSQSDRRGAERLAAFTRDDVRRIADWGFDHIRLPVDEQQMWSASGAPEAEAFDLMDSALDWAEEAGLRMIIDLHILRSHFFISAKEPALFTNPAEAEKFAEFWRQLSARLRRRANDRVAYELMNEAVASNPNDWNRVAHVAFRAIRELEPERTIILGSNRWNSVFSFDQLEVPDDRNMILTFHFYLPMLVTHHQAGWCPEGKNDDGPIQYPGQPIAPEHLGQVREPEKARMVSIDLAEVNKSYGRENMVADIAQPLAVSRRTGLLLYCGEFGVIDRAPQAARLAWYRDLISVFNEFHIGWGNWDYRGEFGIVDQERRTTGIAEAMLGVK